MKTVTLIIAGTESTIPLEEVTIERIIAEAHAMGYDEFTVFCNDKEIETPDDFKVIEGATYIIASPEDSDIKNVQYDIIEDENEPD